MVEGRKRDRNTNVEDGRHVGKEEGEGWIDDSWMISRLMCWDLFISAKRYEVYLIRQCGTKN